MCRLIWFAYFIVAALKLSFGKLSLRRFLYFIFTVAQAAAHPHILIFPSALSPPLLFLLASHPNGNLLAPWPTWRVL